MLNSRGDTLLPIHTKVRLTKESAKHMGVDARQTFTIVNYDTSANRGYTDYYVLGRGNTQKYVHYTEVMEVLPRSSRHKPRIVTDPPTLDQVVQQLGHGNVTEVNVKSDLVQGIHEVSFKVETDYVFPEIMMGAFNQELNSITKKDFLRAYAKGRYIYYGKDEQKKIDKLKNFDVVYDWKSNRFFEENKEDNSSGLSGFYLVADVIIPVDDRFYKGEVFDLFTSSEKRFTLMRDKPYRVIPTAEKDEHGTPIYVRYND